jgi:hypothetical protein
MGAHRLSNSEREALVHAIHALPLAKNSMDTWGLIDALKALGDLDEDQEIAHVLAAPDDLDMQSAAAGLWNSQFDHPYDVAYCQAWNDLPSDDRKVLLVMALKSDDRQSMFSPSLIAQAASLGDPTICSALERWTALPPRRESMINDAIRSFEIAYAALARLRCTLPNHSADVTRPADEAVLACGEIIYWLNRDDLPPAERKRYCHAALDVLARPQDGVAAAIVSEFNRSDFMFAEAAKTLPGSEPVVTDLGAAFPDEIAGLYREALASPTTQSGYFEFFRVESLLESALTALGKWGSSADIPTLRAWSIHPSLGIAAVRAIKAIESESRL